MNLFFRLQEAFKTPVGDLIIFLSLLIITLSFFYLYFWAKFKKNHNLLMKHHFYFKKIEKEQKGIQFIETGLAHIFGKEQTVALASGRFAKSLTLYPELFSESFLERFKSYHLSLKHSDSKAFPHLQLDSDSHSLLVIDSQYVKQDGSTLINLQQLIRQNSLTDMDKEYFLMNLAHTLSALHDQQTENLETLYHGFLMPFSFYLTLDMVGRISNTFIAHHGLVFSMQSQNFREWMLQVKEAQVRIHPMIQQDFEDFYGLLSPEQRELDSIYSMGPACDFYLFGSLATYLFTGKIVSGREDPICEWLPESWKTFIQDCLSLNPQDRPRNFLELKEYFEDAEFSITQDLIRDHESLLNLAETEHQQALKPIFDHIQRTKDENAQFSAIWHQGYQAIKNESWEQAFDIFHEMMKEDPQAFNAHLGLALTHYKKGEQDKAKYHYAQAKKIDGKKISSFYRLIAFDV